LGLFSLVGHAPVGATVIIVFFILFPSFLYI
jgi:hypothetical protein